MVQTRAQRGLLAFRETIENPCVLSVITKHLEAEDLVCFKQISKDSRFNDVIQYRLSEIHQEQTRKQQVLADLQERVAGIQHIDPGKNRVPVIVDMFDIMCANKWLLEYGILKKRIYEKLIEFTKNPLFRDHGKRYLTALFGERLVVIHHVR